jgi:hypothetical protein
MTPLPPCVFIFPHSSVSRTHFLLDMKRAREYDEEEEALERACRDHRLTPVLEPDGPANTLSTDNWDEIRKYLKDLARLSLRRVSRMLYTQDRAFTIQLPETLTKPYNVQRRLVHVLAAVELAIDRGQIMSHQDPLVAEMRIFAQAGHPEHQFGYERMSDGIAPTAALMATSVMVLTTPAVTSGVRYFHKSSVTHRRMDLATNVKLYRHLIMGLVRQDMHTWLVQHDWRFTDANKKHVFEPHFVTIRYTAGRPTCCALRFDLEKSLWELVDPDATSPTAIYPWGAGDMASVQDSFDMDQIIS